MFECIKDFKELMDQKRNYDARMIMVPGVYGFIPAVKVEFEYCHYRVFGTDNQTDLNNIIKDLQSIGMEIEGLE